jgi:hypothetical protein
MKANIRIGATIYVLQVVEQTKNCNKCTKATLHVRIEGENYMKAYEVENRHDEAEIGRVYASLEGDALAWAWQHDRGTEPPVGAKVGAWTSTLNGLAQ